MVRRTGVGGGPAAWSLSAESVGRRGRPCPIHPGGWVTYADVAPDVLRTVDGLRGPLPRSSPSPRRTSASSAAVSERPRPRCRPIRTPRGWCTAWARRGGSVVQATTALGGRGAALAERFRWLEQAAGSAALTSGGTFLAMWGRRARTRQAAGGDPRSHGPTPHMDSRVPTRFVQKYTARAQLKRSGAPEPASGRGRPAAAGDRRGSVATNAPAA